MKNTSFVTAKIVKAARTALDKYYKTHKLTRKDYDALCSAAKHLKSRLQELEQTIERVSEECPGAAHSNAYIGNCMLCAPQWGNVLSAEFTESKE